MFGPIGLGIEGFVQIPLAPMLRNSNWSTYLVGTSIFSDIKILIMLCYKITDELSI
jgi:hypothetical protein